MKKYIITSSVFFALFITLLISSSVMNVEDIFINKWVTYTYRESYDILSKILLIIAIALGLIIISYDLIMFIKNKFDMKKYDKRFLMFYITLIVLIFFYVVFDYLWIVSNKPINDAPAFPSTHILLSSFTYLSFAYLISLKINNRLIKPISYIVSIILIILMFAFRLASGMHYITDLLGGLFLSLTLYFTMICFSTIYSNRKNSAKIEETN